MRFMFAFFFVFVLGFMSASSKPLYEMDELWELHAGFVIYGRNCKPDSFEFFSYQGIITWEVRQLSKEELKIHNTLRNLLVETVGDEFNCEAIGEVLRYYFNNPNELKGK